MPVPVGQYITKFNLTQTTVQSQSISCMYNTWTIDSVLFISLYRILSFLNRLKESQYQLLRLKLSKSHFLKRYGSKSPNYTLRILKFSILGLAKNGMTWINLLLQRNHRLITVQSLVPLQILRSP